MLVILNNKEQNFALTFPTGPYHVYVILRSVIGGKDYTV